MAFVPGLLSPLRPCDSNLGALTFLERGSGTVETSMVAAQLIVVSLILWGAIRTGMRKRKRRRASRTLRS